jgi:PAS domain S-box-containing protein
MTHQEVDVRQSLDSLPIMCWIVNAAGEAEHFNRAWLEFTGRAVEQEEGRGWALGVHPDDAPAWSAEMASALAERRGFTREYRLRARDGSFAWVLETARPRVGQEGQFIGFVGSCVEIGARREAEERLALTVEASPTAMVMVDQTGRIVLVNAQTEKLFGYDRAELLGTSVEVLVPGPFRGVHPGYRRGFLADPRARPMGAGRDLYGQRKDGSMVPVEIGLSPIHTDRGVYVLSSIVDISQRKRAEQAMRESEARLAGVIDSAMDAIITVDSQQRIVLFNAAAERMFGCRADQAMGQALDRFIPARYRPDHRRHIEGFARTGTTSRRMGALGELKALRTNGDEFPIEASISQIVSGGERLFTVILRDITERVRSEGAVRESEERYRAVSELTSDFSYALRIAPEGSVGVDWVTDAFARTSGYSAEELERRGWASIIHPEDEQAFHEHVRRILAGSADSAEFRILTRHGSVRWIRNVGRPVLDAGAGRPTRFVGAAQDVTERREAERRQVIMMAELDHRVKNNLSVVLSIADQTLRTASRPEEFYESFMGRLRALARVHGSLARARWEGVSLKEMVVQTLDLHAGGEPGRMLVEGPDLVLSAWQAQPMCLVLHELATNAVKYGALSVAAGRVRVHWDISGDRGKRLLTLHWEESGGPPVSPPASRGFGSMLIEEGVAYELRGKATLHFRPGGVCCDIVTPMLAGQPTGDEVLAESK